MTENREDRVPVGVVGVGYAGALHAEKYSTSELAELVGVADIDGAKAHEVGQRLGVAGLPDYRELFGRVKCVSIAVPTQAHYQVAHECLMAGVDVLIEKPITANLEDGRKLVDLADSKGLLIQVGHLERFNPVVRQLEGIIAAPKFIECHRLAPFIERGTDVDVVFDLMIHDIDVISSLVRSPVCSIDATGVAVLTDKPDIANARIRFENGCVANVTASRVSMKRERKVRFFQSDAYISLDYDAKSAQVYRMEDRSRGWLGIKGETFDIGQGDALQDEVESFIHSVTTRQVPLVSGEDGLHALEIASLISAQL